MLPIFALLLIGSACGATLNIVSPRAAPVPLAVLVARADNITEEKTTLKPVGLSVVPLVEVVTQTTIEHVETTIAPATTKAQVTAVQQIATVTPRPAKNNGNKKNSARVAALRAATSTEAPLPRFNTVNATRLPATTPSHGKKNGSRLTRIEKTQVEKTVVIGEGLGGDDLQTALRDRREEATTAVVQIIQGSTTETPVINGTVPVVVVSATVIPVEVVNVTVGSGEVVKKELDRPARQLVTGGGVGGVPMGPVGGVGAGMGPMGGMGGLGVGGFNGGMGMGGGMGGLGGGMGLGGFNGGLGGFNGGMASFGAGVGGIGGGMGTGLGGAVVQDTITEEIITP